MPWVYRVTWPNGSYKDVERAADAHAAISARYHISTSMSRIYDEVQRLAIDPLERDKRMRVSGRGDEGDVWIGIELIEVD